MPPTTVSPVLSDFFWIVLYILCTEKHVITLFPSSSKGPLKVYDKARLLALAKADPQCTASWRWGVIGKAEQVWISLSLWAMEAGWRVKEHRPLNFPVSMCVGRADEALPGFPEEEVRVFWVHCMCRRV